MKEVWSLACDTPGQKLLLLALADQERDGQGCWPSLSTLQQRCSMSRQGILNQIEILEKRGWISVNRGGGKSSIYRVTIPVHAVDYIPEKIHAFEPVHRVDQSTELTSPQNGHPVVHRVDQHQSTELTTPVHCVDSNPNEPKVEPKVEPSPPKRARREIQVSEDGLKFADWFKTLIPETHKVESAYRTNWGEAYDELIRIDGRQKEEIVKVCRWARSDSFWKSNFLSPTKLRDRDRQGALFYDVFAERLKPNGHKNGTYSVPRAGAVNTRTYEETTLD